MSDTSLHSSRYQKLADLSEQLNQAILTLKVQKAVAAPDAAMKYPGLAVTQEGATRSRSLLLRFIEELIGLIQQPNTASAVDREYISRLQEKVITQEELSAINTSLRSESTLADWQLSMLDLLLYLLDDERTTLFRKLRTGRRE